MAECEPQAAYAADEKTKAGFVRLIVSAKGLKYSKEIKLSGLRPKTVKKASNATLTVDFGDQNFDMTLKGTSGKLKDKTINLAIKKLPYEIDKEKSYGEPDEDRVLLFLCKKDDKSWGSFIENGLETAEEEDE